MKISFFAICFSFFTLVSAWGQVPMPVGEELQVNTYTTDDQLVPAIASGPAGDFVVVWASRGQDGSNYGIFGQRYDSSGAALDLEFQVNTYTTGSEQTPDVASDGTGDFVIVWNSRSPFAGGSDTVSGQRFSSAGVLQGVEFVVTNYTSGGLALPFLQPRVASDNVGNFVVVWQEPGRDGDNFGIFAQRYDSFGETLGDGFQVNTYTTSAQGFPAVAMDQVGNFLVVWLESASVNTFGQFYDSSGLPRGMEFQVNITSPGLIASVASDSTGSFVVVWNDISGVVGRKYDSLGLPSDVFQISESTSAAVGRGAVATDEDGNFVVLWRGFDQHGYGITARSFGSSGVPLGAEFQVNTYATGTQSSPSVASEETGRFVAVWQTQDGDGAGIAGQLYGSIAPPLFFDGFESGDTSAWVSTIAFFQVPSKLSDRVDK